MANVLLDNAIDQFAKLPGIGRKTALRLVLHMLRQEEADVTAFADALTILKRDVKYCKKCHNISESELCPICADKTRDGSVICVVENIQDVLAIERTMQYKGLYHVLGGIISPMDGIGPSNLEIESLIERIRDGQSGKDGEQQIKEVIFALASTMEGDTTNFYISRKLREFPDVKLSVIARGINVGDELQYTDEVTLGRSILNRTPL
ncbi:MAG: recombination protein RecR [Prevotella sp.]|nr:recombination protein RecR [Prevotella sp.]MBR4521736.1 recombination protein RecR [Prevotella sp.]